MGLSTSLLVVAVATALIPIVLVGGRSPGSVRDVEKAVVSAMVVAVVGSVIVHGFHGLNFFGLVHALYLFVVVTVPLLFGGWYLLSHRHGRRRFDAGLGAAATVLALCGLYGTHVEPSWLRVDEAQVRADVSASVRVGVIADLQTPSVGDHEHAAVDAVLERAPDMVVVPGDWFQGHAEVLQANRDDFVALLKRLVDGTKLVAVVSGDSDHTISVESIAEQAGAHFIDDSVLAFELNGVPIRLAGVRVLADGPDRGATLASLATPTDGFTLLLAHRPDVVYELTADSDVDLVVAGHTHGGQVQLPFVGPPVTFSDVPRDVAAGGLGVVNNVPLYVSAGVGLERLQAPQVRFGARPEVGIIEIVPR